MVTNPQKIDLESSTTDLVSSSLKNILENVGNNQLKVNKQMEKIAQQEETKICDLLALQMEVSELGMHVECASSLISASKHACSSITRNINQ